LTYSENRLNFKHVYEIQIARWAYSIVETIVTKVLYLVEFKGYHTKYKRN